MRKLSEVMALVSRVPKNGRNDFHKYDYVTEADILDAVRTAMAERRLILVPSAVDAKSESVGDKGDRLFTLRQRFTVHDGDSGEELAFDMYGQGSDKLDKGCYKAATGAEKYALLKLFMIPTGDDPEREESGGKREIPPPAGLDAIKKHIGSSGPNPSPPPAATQAARPANAADDWRGFVMPFANKEKLPLRELTEKSLNWYRSALTQNIADPSKARFAEEAKRQLGLIQDEMAERGL